MHDLFFQETCAYMHLELNIQACQYLKYCVCMRQRVFGFHLSLQYGHRLGQRVKLCDTGRCQVMTKLCRSGRSDVLREREEVMVVVVSPEIKLGNGCPSTHNFTFSTIIDKVAPPYH